MIQEHMKTVRLTPCAESKFPLVEGLRFFHDTDSDLYYFNATEPLLRADAGKGLGVERFFSLRECCLLYTSPRPRDRTRSRMPSSA